MSQTTVVDTLGFFASVSLLLRFISATATHPRLGVIVDTVRVSMGDIVNLVILISVLFVGFILIATVQFSGTDNYFGSVLSSIAVMWDIFVGGSSDKFIWYDRPERILFLFIFALFMFFLALNVFIAIIVEGYLEVKRNVETFKAEADVMTDLVQSFHAEYRQHRHRLPPKHELVAALNILRPKQEVSPSDVHAVLPAYSYHTLRLLFEYYNTTRFPFLSPSENPHQDANVSLPTAVNDVEHRMAMMLRTKMSTPLGRVADLRQRMHQSHDDAPGTWDSLLAHHLRSAPSSDALEPAAPPATESPADSPDDSLRLLGAIGIVDDSDPLEI